MSNFNLRIDPSSSPYGDMLGELIESIGSYGRYKVIRGKFKASAPYLFHCLRQNELVSLLLDKVIYLIYVDGSGRKMIKFEGYYYLNGDDGEMPYRHLEWCGFEIPFTDYITNREYFDIDEIGSERKQQICELSFKDVVSGFSGYYCGTKPDCLPLSKLSINTSCGCYVDCFSLEL